MFSSLTDPSDIFSKENYRRFIMAETTTIDIENTVIGDIRRNTQEQNEKAEQQIRILKEQNRLLKDNYDTLKKMYDSQNKKLKHSQCYNAAMMVISFIAMLAAVVSSVVACG